MTAKPLRSQQGFTLIEMIAGIVIFAMAMVAMSAALFPQAIKSVDPVYQVRAAELGQSLMNEIMGKGFDEHSDYHRASRCGEPGANACTITADLGPDGESIDQFDDVDDYHGYDQRDAQLSAGGDYQELYRNFTFSVSVSYDDDYDAEGNDDQHLFKRVVVTVITPARQNFKFVGYKGNY